MVVYKKKRLRGYFMVRSIVLRPIKIDDFAEVLKWNRNEEFCLLNEWELHRDESVLCEWWKKCCDIQHSLSFRRLGIEVAGRLIGYADIAEIEGNTAELGIAIGDSSIWGQGIGTSVLKELMQYGKETLAIEEFYAETKISNLRSRKMLEKLGFSQTDIKEGAYYFKIIYTDE